MPIGQLSVAHAVVVPELPAIVPWLVAMVLPEALPLGCDDVVTEDSDPEPLLLPSDSPAVDPPHATAAARESARLARAVRRTSRRFVMGPSAKE
jgi:hypothetical protein